jgi:hypothetical protein
MKPLETMKEGRVLKAGDIVGQVVDFERVNAKMERHIHLPAALIADELPVSEVRWKNMWQLPNFHLCDPLDLIKVPYQMLP